MGDINFARVDEGLCGGDINFAMVDERVCGGMGKAINFARVDGGEGDINFARVDGFMKNVGGGRGWQTWL